MRCWWVDYENAFGIAKYAYVRPRKRGTVHPLPDPRDESLGTVLVFRWVLDMAERDMLTIEVNNRKVEARERETILTALKRAGVNVPTLCHMEDLSPTGACRLCVVEVEGQRGLIPSCAYPVSDGMKIKTHSPRVMRARKTVLELLLASHPDDCLYCVRNGH
jgi:hypothetical protein